MAANKTRDLLIQVRSLLRQGDLDDLRDAGQKMSQLARSGSPELYYLSLETDFWNAAVNYMLGSVRIMNCDYYILHFAARWRNSVPEAQREKLPPPPEAQIINAYDNLLVAYDLEEEFCIAGDLDDDFDPFEMCKVLCEAFLSLVRVNECAPPEEVQQAMCAYIRSPGIPSSCLLDVLLGFASFDDFHENPNEEQLYFAEHVLRQFLGLDVVFKPMYFDALKYILKYTDETGLLWKYGIHGDGLIIKWTLAVFQMALNGLHAGRRMDVGFSEKEISIQIYDLTDMLQEIIFGCGIDLMKFPVQVKGLRQFFCKEIDPKSSQAPVDDRSWSGMKLLNILKFNENALPIFGKPDLFIAFFNFACELGIFNGFFAWETLSMFLFSDLERTLLPTTVQLIDKVENLIKGGLANKDGAELSTTDFPRFIEFLAALCRHTLITPECGRSRIIPQLLVVALDVPAAKSAAAHGLADLFTLSEYRERTSSTIDRNAKNILLHIVSAQMWNEPSELQFFTYCFQMISNLAKHSTLQHYLGCCSLSCTMVRCVEMCDVDPRDPEMIKGFKELAITTLLCSVINVARWNDTGKDSFTQHYFIDKVFEPILRQYTYDPLITELMFHAWFTLCSKNEWAMRDTTQCAEMRKSIVVAFDKWKDDEKIAMRACKFIRLLCRDTKVVSKLFAKLKVADIIKQSKASPAFKSATLSCFSN